MTDKRKIIVDGREYEVDPGLNLLQALEEIGIEVPRFCYHERLSVAGNCRMCMVEVVGGPPKPTASCSMQVKDLRGGRNGELPEIKTTSPMVKKAREGAMEFLLINHPLDCPICDQGGECDLQDQAMAYGRPTSRYTEAKRVAEDPDLGPLVATHMTRCISCTRCVRFTTEVAGIIQMGQIGRGEDAEVTSYLGQTLDSNLQGNVIDLCPVGALTSKPYAFTARPWELTKTETVDVMDGLGANIRVDTKGREVKRIMPLNNDAINEEWISDKSRFIWDGLRRQRLDVPYVRGADGKLKKASWEEALSAAADAMKGRKVLGLVGDLEPTEAAFSLKQLIEEIGGSVECRTDGAKLPAGNRSAYVGTAAIADIDTAKEIVLIGTDPRNESPVLNARIRKVWLKGTKVTLVGPKKDLTYDYTHAGDDRAALAALVAKAAPAENALVIVGQGAIDEADGTAVLSQAMALADKMGAKFMVLHTAAGRVGAMDVGAVTEGGLEAAVAGVETIYNLGADEIDVRPRSEGGPFVIYQGSHGDRGANRADVILPAAAYTEENGLFVNTEGRPQLAFRAAFAPGEARENWAILRALSAKLGKTQPWTDLAGLRRAMVAAVPHLARVGEVIENEWQPLPLRDMATASFRYPIRDFYFTNPIARASVVMAECSALAKARAEGPAMAAE